MSTMSLEDKRLEEHRVAQQQKHTAGLRPGWYVTTGFFWHDTMQWVAGPFSTQEDAMTCRHEIEVREGHHAYYVDEVGTPAAAVGGEPQ